MRRINPHACLAVTIAAIAIIVIVAMVTVTVMHRRTDRSSLDWQMQQQLITVITINSSHRNSSTAFLKEATIARDSFILCRRVTAIITTSTHSIVDQPNDSFHLKANSIGASNTRSTYSYSKKATLLHSINN